ncbi:MAG: PQQ-binding-like beta-propeller repeat protein [Planctomycetaceae bacterium]|nr:PQQ-binding-like beta-propeller repeat protein [Planctomycetaceae bacterium]
MQRSKSARALNLLALMMALTAVLVVSAQTPAPPASDADQPGPMRERRLVQRLEQARQLLAPREPNDKPEESQALRLLQTLLDDGAETDDAPETDDVFLDTPAGERRVVGHSLRGEARRLIGGMSAQGRQAYELLYGKGARVQLDAALADGDWPEVEEVARRFFHTSAGYDATITLGLRELDLGEPMAAASRFQEVRDWPHARAAREPLLSLRLALAWRLAGQDDNCRTVLIDLKKSFGERPLERRDGGDLTLFKNDAEALDWFDRWAGVPVRPLRATGERRDEWPLMAGNAARNAISGAAVPTEHVAWSHMLLDDDGDPLAEEDTDTPIELNSDRSPTLLRGAWGRVRTEVRSEIERRRQMDRPAIIAAQPIVVGNTVVVRSLSQLRAFRLSDGQPLWHSAMVEPELAEMLSDNRRGRAPRRISSELESWLQQRVWEDVGNGTLSSDGELVFALQEREASLRASQVAWRGMFVTREFNKLIAIEAATGRLRWEIGGPRGDLELSGSGAFFLGPPLPWRGRLYVLTDDGIDLRLAVLDPRDGKLMWMQTLAPSDPLWGSMIRDAGLSPTIAGDCVICPTGAGTIVAIDPVRRELRWQSVHREPVERLPRPQFQFSPFQPPNSVSDSLWQQSVPIAVRDRVLIAPPDSGVLLCLDLRDGHVLWQQPRGEGLFLAGIANEEAVLIVSANDVRSVRLADGKPAWPRAVPITSPMGRGVMIEGVLHLPQVNGEVVSIEARTGRMLARREVAIKELLGNLIAADGRLVSQSATHIAAFPQLREQQRTIAAALLKNEDDARTLEDRGRMNLHLGLRVRGLEDLRRAIALSPTAEAKQALAGLLLEEVRYGQTADLDATVRELETLLDDPKQRLLFARLRAASFQRRGELLLAARELLKLADAWEPSSELEISHGATVARQDRWIAAEMLELHAAMPAKDRDVFRGEIETRLRANLISD